ncbi:MAG TPA: nuclear transport factor 2 family protein [Myxococcota bacterium]|nr:nuclear transport factor 2 family protein [Myxococcota bacterium]
MTAISIVDGHLDAVLRGDVASLPALLTPDFRMYLNDELVAEGRDAAVARLLPLQRALPRRSLRVHERVAAGDRVRQRWTLDAWPPDQLASANAPIRIDGASWTVCRDGLVAELYQWFDVAAVRRQLDRLPAPLPPCPAAFQRAVAR